MDTLNTLEIQLTNMKRDFQNQYKTLVCEGSMTISDFAKLTLELAETIVALEKAVKELKNGMFKFNFDGTVAVTYLSHFDGRKYFVEPRYKTVTTSLRDCLISLKSLNINKHLLLKSVNLS